MFFDKSKNSMSECFGVSDHRGEEISRMIHDEALALLKVPGEGLDLSEIIDRLNSRGLTDSEMFLAMLMLHRVVVATEHGLAMSRALDVLQQSLGAHLSGPETPAEEELQ